MRTPHCWGGRKVGEAPGHPAPLLGVRLLSSSGTRDTARHPPTPPTYPPTYLPTYLPTHLPTQKGARPTPFRSGDALGEPPSEGSDINTLDKKVFFLETIWETQQRTIVSLEQLCWKFLFSGKSGFQGSKKVDDGKINWNTTW